MKTIKRHTIRHKPWELKNRSFDLCRPALEIAIRQRSTLIGMDYVGGEGLHIIVEYDDCNKFFYDLGFYFFIEEDFDVGGRPCAIGIIQTHDLHRAAIIRIDGDYYYIYINHEPPLLKES